MFIRKTHKKDRLTGKKYFIFQLVESYRTERGPRQRILLNLGKDLDLTKEDQKSFANRIEELLIGSKSLFPYPEHIETLAEKYAAQLIKKPVVDSKIETKTERDLQLVDLDSLEHEYCRSVGIEHLAYETIKQLKLKEKLAELGMSKRQIEIAIGVIICRLVHPNSELATYKWLQKASAVDELIGTDFNKLALKSVYEVGDNLLKHKNAIEGYLREQEKSLFNLDDTILFYDLTNTYFEGVTADNPKAKRGHSKEKRSDCALVTLALVIDNQGFPLRSEMLPGNVSEPATLQEALNKLLGNSCSRPIVVLDAGISSEENLLYLRENGYRYIVSSKSRSVELPSDIDLKEVSSKDGNIVRAGKGCSKVNGETLLYCHSSQRQKKEEAMGSLLQKRYEQALEQASQALSKKNGTKSYKKVLERIGRLKERHNKVSRHYAIIVTADEKEENAVSITWEKDKNKLENRFQGLYSLRVFGLDWESEQLWHTYVMLTLVEEAFHCLKTDLGLRPIYHQKESRVDAHLFITILAYHVMQTILYRLRISGISIRWKTLQNDFSSRVRVTSSMRLSTGEQVHIRSTTRPEAAQKRIYEALGFSTKVGKRIKVYI